MRLICLTRNTLILSLLSCSFIVLADNPCPQVAHTWNNIVIKDKTAPWNAQLTMTNEEGGFVDTGCQFHDSKFLFNTLSPENSVEYGFHFDPADDFNVSYSLVITQHNLPASNYVAKVCHFIITATGPTRPDIRVIAYNGAKCSYTDQKVGTQYIVE